MIVGRFLLWARDASPGQRAEATSALARAYLYSDLDDAARRDAETALTAMLDDSSALVRRALAEVFANASDAPRHLVLALANDQRDIAALVLARSPVLTDADLVDCAALGDALTRSAIARRPGLSAAVAGALAEIAEPAVLVVLAGNAAASLAPSSLARMVERCGDDGDLREALLRRPDLPLDVRQSIAVALSRSLARFVAGCGWLTTERSERVVQEAQDRTTVALSSDAAAGDVLRLVEHLRRTGQLTPALILRAILSRRLHFAEAAFADLAGLPVVRVAGLLSDRRAGNFAALYRRAGLPEPLRPAFEAAVSALREDRETDATAGAALLSRRMVERVLSACSNLPPEEAGRLLAMLRRFEVEAARDEARHMADAMADAAALAAIMAAAPGILLDHPGERLSAAA